MAINPQIKALANLVRNAVYGKEVRKSIADSMELTSETTEETKNRQNSLEGQFQTVIEETTGKDVISAPEIIAARGTHDNLSKRLLSTDQQLAETARFENNKNISLKKLNVTPKAITNFGGGTVMVVSKKPHGRGFVRFKLREGQHTTNVSVGSPSELLRVIEVLDVVEAFTYLKTPIRTNDSTLWTTSDINYVIVGVGQQTIPVNSTATRQIGNWLEYDIALPKGENEVSALIYKSSGSSTDVNVSVDGENVFTGLDFSGSGFERLVIPVGVSGKHTIRFTTTALKHLNVAGVNVVDLDNYQEGYDYDTLVTIVKTADYQYVLSDGAMDYALLDGDTDLWCGSYHGGEKRNRLEYIIDGQRTALNAGDVAIGRVIEIEQDTTIVNKLNAYSTQRFEGDGSVEHETIFEGSMNLKTLFTNMTTALDNFDEIVYPVRDTMNGKERIYLPQGVNYVVQRNPVTMQKVTTIMNNKKFPQNSTIVPYIKKTVGAYNKLYNANIQSDTPVEFNGDYFKTTHIFE